MSCPVSKGLQCKDIPDEMFLRMVDNAAWARDRPYALFFDVQTYLSIALDIQLSRQLGFPVGFDGDLISTKLVRNKARKLIRRGLMTGCYCGCRGEWRIVEKVTLSGDAKYLKMTREGGLSVVSGSETVGE